MSFIPTPFATPVVPPDTASMSRSTPYLSPSEYRYAPTAVATNALVAGSTNQQVDSLASLAQVIARASSQIDQYLFHRPEGTLAASLTIESDWYKVKPDGSIILICNFKPIMQVVGVAIGPSPSQLMNLTSQAALDITTGNKTITLPGSWNSGLIAPNFSIWPSVNGNVYAVYSYVTGFHNSQLAVAALAGATSITVSPAVPGGAILYGVNPGTQLTIHDDANTEVVTVSSLPTGLTIDLTTPLQYAHSLPSAPDFVRVTAVPWQVEQAAINFTSFYIKAQGFRGMNLPAIGSPQAGITADRAGARTDYESGLELLESFRTVFIH